MNRAPRDAGGWLPWLGLLTLAGGAIYQAAGLQGDVARHAERITVLEATDRVRQIEERKRDERGARIEAKLDLLTTPTREDHR